MSRSVLAPSVLQVGGYDFMVGPTRAWRNQGPNKLVLFCHGSGGTTQKTLSDQQRFTILDFGQDMVCICSEWGGENWGNDASITAMHAAVTYAQANLGCAGPIGIVGASMGNLTATNYARAHPSNVGAIASVIPAIDIQSVFTIAPSYIPLINAAYPPSYDDTTVGATHNPIHMAENGLLDDDLPIKIWSLSTDTLATPERSHAFVTARPQTEIEDFSGAGIVHGAIAVEYVRTEVVAWMKGKLS